MRGDIGIECLSNAAKGDGKRKRKRKEEKRYINLFFKKTTDVSTLISTVP